MKNILILSALFFISIVARAQQISASNNIGCSPLEVKFSTQLNNVKSYDWDFGNGSVSTLANPSVLYMGVGEFDVSLSVVYNNDNTEVFTNSAFIKVINNPIADFDIVEASNCLNEEVEFVNESIQATSYIWDFGDGNSSELKNPKHTYLNAGVYSITLIAMANENCMGIKEYTNAVTIHPPSNLDFQAGVQEVCLDQSSVQFSSNAGFTSWLWDFGDGTQSTVADPSHSYTQPGLYNVTLTVGDVNGCTATLTKANFVEIFALPEIQVDLSESVICTNGSIEFTNQTENTQNITWSFSDGYTSTDDSFIREFGMAGNYNVDINLTNSNGCTAQSTYSTAIQVLDAETATIEISENEGCAPFTVSFNNTTSDATSYTWEINGLVFSSASVEYTFLNPGVYPIRVKTLHQSGCTRTLEYDTPIIVHESEIEIDTEKYTGCVPFETSFGLSNPNVSNINWNFGNGDTSSITSPSVVYAIPGVYEVKASFINEYGCPDSVALDKFVNVRDTIVNFVPPQPIYACNTLEIYFTGAMGQDFWQWDFGDGVTSDVMNPTHIYKEKGNYTVSLVTNNHSGCRTSILKYNEIVITDIEVDFTASILDGASCPNFSVQFENLSNYTDVLWDFGDGTTSTDLNPIHNYQGTSQFTASLIISDTLGCSKSMATIITAPWPYCDVPAGDPTPDSALNIIYYHTIRSCTAPFEINFTNPKPDAIDWKWYFGDGATSEAKDPSHVFEEFGEYYVDLLATNNDGGIDSIMGYTTVIIQNALVDFNHSIQKSCNGAEVEFFNTNNTLVDWLWNLGNGTISNDKDPREIYLVDAVYQVSLDVVDSAGCVGKTVKNIVIGNPYKEYDYPDEICLGDSIAIDHNLQFYKTYEWDFGDGTVQTVKYPNHLYTKNGEFQITLNAIGQDGCIQTINLPYTVTVNHPQADFEVVGEKHGCNNFLTSFKNLSLDAEEWHWDFGNGITSEEENPEVEFGPGKYTVQLVASKNGCSDTIFYKDYIVVDRIRADFEFTQDKICLPVSVTFNNKSKNGKEWLWDFGDNSQSTEKNPTHVYYELPEKEVTLIIKSSSGCESEVTKPLSAFFKPDFSTDQSFVCVPDEIAFQSNTEGAKVWFWDFGDGSTGKGQNVSHTYTKAGEFTVKLVTQSISGCYDTLVQEKAIKSMDIKPNFKANVTDGTCAPLLVSFENLSTGTITKYQWDFGDGTTSESVNPFHVYNNVGDYDVRLRVLNQYGCIKDFSISNLVTTTGPEAQFSVSDSIACNPATIQFQDLSQSAVEWQWFFGDGQSSELQSPSYQYKEAGTYNISLLATDQNGCQEYASFNSLRVIETPKAKFNTTTSGNCLPVEVKLNNTSTQLQNASYSWDFGDGTTSNEENPVKIYSKPGKYHVKLQVVNDLTCDDSSISPDEIMVYDTTQVKEPEVLELSVLQTDKIQIKLKHYESNNLKYHLVYCKPQNQKEYYLIDSIKNPLATLFSDDNVNTQQNAYYYKIQTHDYCNTPEDLEDLNTYVSVNLSAESKEEGISLLWTTYEGHAYDDYSILRQAKGSKEDWNELSRSAPGESIYEDHEDLCPGDYEYKVVANNLGGYGYNSSSNIIVERPKKNVFLEQKVDVIRTTIIDNSKTLTEWKPPTIGPDKVEYYRIWRIEPNNAFTLVGKTYKGITSFVDNYVDVEEYAYQYKVDVINTCDVEGLQSNVGSSILLEKETDHYINKLKWIPYKGWNQGVKEYLLQRQNEYGEWETIKVLLPTDSTYTIDLSND